MHRQFLYRPNINKMDCTNFTKYRYFKIVFLRKEEEIKQSS